jgi:hypothetical protein
MDPQEYSFDVDMVAERDERRLAMARHAAPITNAVEDADGRKQSGSAAALVIVRRPTTVTETGWRALILVMSERSGHPFSEGCLAACLTA